MKRIDSRKRKIAFILLSILGINILSPLYSYALTSGPAQPEAQGFTPAGVSDMVDLQSGDFKYNIPLLDIDGYPINLSYQSGSGIDDEASWVGMGWSLNTGSVNRQVRGVPDDMNGDEVTTEQTTKPMVTIGGRVSGKIETIGKGVQVNGGGSLSIGAYINNYTGVGAYVGINAGISLGNSNSDPLTGGLGVGVTSDSQNGVTVSPNISLSVNNQAADKNLAHAGLSASLGYNSRSGLKSLGLGASFSDNWNAKQGKPTSAGIDQNDSENLGLTNISYNTEPVNPRIQVPYKTQSFTFSIDVGYSGDVVFAGGGITGYKNVRQVLNPIMKNRSYGFLYADRGKNNPNAMMDFIRENENPVIPELPNLAVPVQTPDLFSYASQTGSGQFRLYRGGSGAFFDNEADDQSDNQTAGGDAGIGAGSVHFGVTYYKQEIHNNTRKWANGNGYLASGDFESPNYSDPTKEHVYFKQVGEHTMQDKTSASNLQNTLPVQVSLGPDNKPIPAFDQTGSFNPSARNSRAARTTMISYLTASEASFGALDQHINNYAAIDYPATSPLPAEPSPVTSYNRDDANGTTPYYTAGNTGVAYSDGELDPIPHKSHHISEITVTDAGGKRMVYGLPVYNVEQDEYTVAVSNVSNNGSDLYDSPPTVSGGGQASPYNHSNYANAKANNLVNINQAQNQGAGKGLDNYYHRESKPPFATSYLLTAILSPDYVDKTGDGITNDDAGTAIKFNYSRLPYLYNWRTPFAGATLNKGLAAVNDDDKASVICGKKEIWYISSIESKTKIAYFITTDRYDALGAGDDWWTGGANNAMKQKCLKEIRLYAKSDMTKPIKIVKFDYDYTTCPYIPNFYNPDASVTPGKLTLRKVWFQYQNVSKGSNFPYVFHYNQPGVTDINQPGAYGYMSTDRWGVYKPQSENPLDGFGSGNPIPNDEYPYSTQNKPVIDNDVALFQLNRIDLPTGGAINVKYESDDYAYVQNRRAAVMSQIVKLIDIHGNDIAEDDQAALVKAHGIRVSMPATMTPPAAGQLNWFKKYFLSGSNYLYTKLFVKMSTKNNTDDSNTNPDYYDYVSSYNQVTGVSFSSPASDGSYTAIITFKDINVGNLSTPPSPMVVSAWQKLKNEYPRYAYPGYNTDNHGDINENSSIPDVVSALLTAISNISELTKNFYQTASNSLNSYCGTVKLARSFARLGCYNRLVPNSTTDLATGKLGGGARVSKIYISDNWQGLTNSNNVALTGIYGQSYDYTTVDSDGSRISSGVASYEPHIGSDENPFKQPVPYSDYEKGTLSTYLDLEEPFGESVFPAPGVTYSKVTVRDLIKGGSDSSDPTIVDPDARTGTVINEFYTTRDFPVRVSQTPINTIHNHYNPSLSFIKTVSDDELYMTQGYSVQLNDMNGKQKAVSVLDKSGALISSTQYIYKADAAGDGSYNLNNNVQVLNRDGSVSAAVLGQEIEMFTDFREEEGVNTGTAVNLGGDVFTVGIIPIFIPHVPIEQNNDYKRFNSACAFKVVQNYGVLDHVIKTQNGSSITTQNIAFDGNTGDALITKTQNEFNKDIYSVSIPAYWAYPRMGPAYSNQGVMLGGTDGSSTVINTDDNGVIADHTTDPTTGAGIPSIYSYLTSGDEFIDLDPAKSTAGSSSDYGKRFWVVEQTFPGLLQSALLINGGVGTGPGPVRHGTTTSKVIMDVYGRIKPNYSSKLIKIVRAGNRNLFSADITKIVCLRNPLINGKLQLNGSQDLTETLRVINASATTYDERWAVDPPYIHAIPSADANLYSFGFQRSGTSNVYSGNNIPPGLATIPNGASQYLSDNMISNSTIDVTNSSIAANDVRTAGAYDSFTVTQAGNYYVRYDSNYVILSLKLDGCDLSWLVQNWYNYYSWGNTYVNQPIHLTAGKHTIQFEMSTPVSASTSPRGSFYPGAAIAIYASVQSGNGGGSTNPTIWSTGKMVAGATNPTYYLITADGNHHYHDIYTDGLNTPYEPCATPNNAINPFIYGYMGNWRPYETKVFQQSRVYGSLNAQPNPVNNATLNSATNNLDIKNAGYINQFYTAWYPPSSISGGGNWTLDLTSSGAGRWVTANTVTLYDRYGQQLENSDALGRYSAAKFDFNGELPGAVASNSRNREIYENSFEDAFFSIGSTNYVDVSQLPDFVNPTSGKSITSYLTSNISNQVIAHSGKTSVAMPSDGFTLNTVINTVDQHPQTYLDFDVNNFNQYIKRPVAGLYPNGFEPMPQKYIMDVWINDGMPQAFYEGLNITIGSTPVIAKVKASVESWKLVEAVLDFSHLTANADGSIPVSISISPTVTWQTVYLDDIRIHPYSAEMKTYVYDYSSMRLMAELDENAFATFYEYDSQGLLVRVKKETEKGVVTLKESRSSYKKASGTN